MRAAPAGSADGRGGTGGAGVAAGAGAPADVALAATIVSLVIVNIIVSGLYIRGPATYVLATLIIWAFTAASDTIGRRMARDRRRDRGVELSAVRWYEDAAAMAADPEIEVVVEAIGGEMSPGRFARSLLPVAVGKAASLRDLAISEIGTVAPLGLMARGGRRQPDGAAVVVGGFPLEHAALAERVDNGGDRVGPHVQPPGELAGASAGVLDERGQQLKLRDREGVAGIGHPRAPAQGAAQPGDALGKPLSFQPFSARLIPLRRPRPGPRA